MKISIILSALFLTNIAFAATPLDGVVKKIDRKLINLEQGRNKTLTIEKSINVPWSVVDKRESDFTASVVDAYDYLKAHKLTERYNFMYESLKANALGYPRRVNALKSWLHKENTRLLKKGLSKPFYVKWEILVSKIDARIEELAKPKPEVSTLISSPGMNHAQYDFLNEVRTELTKLRQQKGTQVVAKASAPAPVKFATQENLAILVLCCSLSLLVGIGFRFKKQAPEALAEVANDEVNLPPLPQEIITQFDEDDFKPVPFYAVNLEDECGKTFSNNQHLLNSAQIKVYPTLRSPFKTDVNIKAEKVSEALNWLLKGTLAIANSQATVVSNLEWNCKENDGRVYLDIILHGLECNQNSLYLNTLVDTDMSAPAYFGRTEMALDGHLPSVLLKSENKKTIVSLSMDSSNSAMTN